MLANSPKYLKMHHISTHNVCAPKKCGTIRVFGELGAENPKSTAFCLQAWTALIPHDVLRDVFIELASSVYPAGRVKCPDLPGQRGMVSWRSFCPDHRPDGVVMYFRNDPAAGASGPRSRRSVHTDGNIK